MNTFFLLNIAIVISYYIVVGRYLQRQYREYSISAFFILAPVGLCVLAFLCYATILLATVTKSDNAMLYFLIPISIVPFAFSELKICIKNKTPILNRNALVGLLLAIICFFPIIQGSYQNATNPTFDHDISQYIGYSQDILVALPTWSYGFNWQSASDFKIPHSNLYTSLLTWASLLSGPSNVFSDSHIKVIPLLYNLALLFSVIGLFSRFLGGKGLALGLALTLAIPLAWYTVSALSIDGFLLVAICTMAYLTERKSSNITMGILLAFTASAHTLGAIYSCFFFGCFILTSLFRDKKFDRSALITTFFLFIGLFSTYIGYEINSDSGFHYKYYFDAILKSNIMNNDSLWNSSKLPIEWASKTFHQFSVIIIFVILFSTFNFVKQRTLKPNISILFISLLAILYILSLIPLTEKIGNAFTANFRYALGLKIIALICVAHILLNQNMRIPAYLFLSFSIIYLHNQGLHNYSKYYYDYQETKLVYSILGTCKELETYDNFQIFTDDIRINRLCGSNYTFIFSEKGQSRLKECNNKSCLFLSREANRSWKGSEFIKNTTNLELNKNIYGLEAYKIALNPITLRKS